MLTSPDATTATTAAAGRASAAGRALRRAHGALATYLGVGGVLLVAVVVLAATQPTFATPDNLVNVLETNAALLLVAVGLTFVLLVGGFDLSVGGLLALTGVLLAMLLHAGAPPYAAMAAVVAVAAVLGAATNGLLVGRAGLSFFVVTLGTMSVFRGGALLLTGGESQGLYDVPQVVAVGTARVLGLPVTVGVSVGAFVAAVLITRYTGFGRMLYAVGGNPEAARLAGIKVAAVRAAAYTICAGLAGLAAVLQTGRLAAASPTSASGIELVAAAAVLLGGTSFAGGQGGMVGTLLGVLFLGVLANGLTISQVSAFWQNVITGTVLVVAVVLDRLRARREAVGRW
jgi:ribose transport system permease protein